MLCSSKPAAYKYMNYIASALRVVTDCPNGYKSILVDPRIESISEQVQAKVDWAFSNGEEILFECLAEYRTILDNKDVSERFLIAHQLILCLDQRITYEPTAHEHNYSISCLVPFTTERIVPLQTLNDNSKETGICLAPIFPAVTASRRGSTNIEHRIFNRDSLFGMNGELEHCRYYKHNDHLEVHHCIVRPIHGTDMKEHYFRVAFAPICRCRDALKTREKEIIGNGTREKVIVCEGPHNPEIIENRFENVLKAIARLNSNVDLLFGPEMFGTEQMYEEDEAGINLYIENVSQEAAEFEGTLPEIIVLPSITGDGYNYCHVLNGDGVLLGSQSKQEAYIDYNNHCREAINELDTKQLLVLHIPGRARIVIMLCADFLAGQNSEMNKVIFESINPTLVIVPSYTPGEEDFINKLASKKEYGASVVWGTSCSAVRAEEPYIGGCGIVGMDAILRMRDACRCNYECEDKETCMFIIDIPLKYQMGEPIQRQFHHYLEGKS